MDKQAQWDAMFSRIIFTDPRYEMFNQFVAANWWDATDNVKRNTKAVHTMSADARWAALDNMIEELTDAVSPCATLAKLYAKREKNAHADDTGDASWCEPWLGDIEGYSATLAERLLGWLHEFIGFVKTLDTYVHVNTGMISVMDVVVVRHASLTEWADMLRARSLCLFVHDSPRGPGADSSTRDSVLWTTRCQAAVVDAGQDSLLDPFTMLQLLLLIARTDAPKIFVYGDTHATYVRDLVTCMSVHKGGAPCKITFYGSDMADAMLSDVIEATNGVAPASNVFMHEHMRHLKDALGDHVYTFFARMQKITGIEFHKVDMDVALAQLADKQVTLGNVEAACRAANIPARWDQFNQSIRD